jgi:hypothetical protein
MLHCMSPLLAQSGHWDRAQQCPLSGVKRFAVRAQQSSTVRRIGVLMNYRADEPEGQARAPCARFDKQDLARPTPGIRPKGPQ